VIPKCPESFEEIGGSQKGRSYIEAQNWKVADAEKMTINQGIKQINTKPMVLKLECMESPRRVQRKRGRQGRPKKLSRDRDLNAVEKVKWKGYCEVGQWQMEISSPVTNSVPEEKHYRGTSICIKKRVFREDLFIEPRPSEVILKTN
jgi:hypothetical protein